MKWMILTIFLHCEYESGFKEKIDTYKCKNDKKELYIRAKNIEVNKNVQVNMNNKISIHCSFNTEDSRYQWIAQLPCTLLMEKINKAL